jgi:alpha-galactosidase
MPTARAVAIHTTAGRVEATRIALRAREGTVAPRAEDAPAPETSAPWRGPGSAALSGIELEITLDAQGDSASFDLVARNRGTRPVFVESVALGLRWARPGSAPLRFLRNGWQSWSSTGARDLDAAGEPAFPSGPWLRGLHHAQGQRASERSGWHESHLATVVGETPSGPACLAGVLERGRAFGVIHARREGDDVLLEVEQVIDARIAPGEERALERVRVGLGDDASRLLERFAELHGRLASARTAQPFLGGWCSWYHFFDAVSEADVLRNLEALAASRPALCLDVVQIDDGYQRAIGDWLETNAKFPRGLAPLAREIRAAGFVAGIWTAPFCVVAESRIFAAQRDWLLRNGEECFRGLLHPAWSRDASVYVLDPSRPEVRAHLATLFRELRALGFDYLKLDFLYAAAMRADAFDPALSRAGRLRAGLDAIRSGAGEGAFLLGCGCPLGAAVGVVDGMRIGPDVAPSWRAQPAVSIPGIEDTLPSTRSAVRSVLARAWMHRRLWLNDPDCLMARGRDTQLSGDEARSLAVAIAATGGMALFSDDLPALGATGLALVRETLAGAREVDGLGLPGHARAHDLLAGEFAGAVAAGDAAGGLLALFNSGDEPALRELDLPVVRLAPLVAPPEPLLGSPPAKVDANRRLSVSLAPHASAFYRLRRAFQLGVFCDFDGTFSVQDVGATLAKIHAAERRPLVWARFERGEITAWQYNLEILDRLALPEAELEAFLRTIELDPGAIPLVDWCRAREIPFRVLSDGFDYNLNRLQVQHGVDFAYDANHLRYEDGRWRIRGAHPNPACGCGTGTCKRGRIEEFRAAHPGAQLVHIGNGRVSDLCGALAADVAFAKDSLAGELAQRGVGFEPFETLLDVIPRLERLLEKAVA